MQHHTTATGTTSSMFEPASNGGLAALLKVYGLKAVLGALGACALFLVLWPRTRQEGAARLFSGILSSVLWGDVALAWVRSGASWIPAGAEMDRAIYAAVGGLAWFVLGIGARVLDRHRATGVIPTLSRGD